MRNVLLTLCALLAAALAWAQAPTASTPDDRPVLVCFGDSITYGYGVTRAQAYPALLQQAFDAKGIAWRVINAGRSGDTTAHGLSRLDRVLRFGPAVVLVEFGGNDVANGFPLAMTRANLEKLITTLQSAGARVVLASRPQAANTQATASRRAALNTLFTELAAEHHLTLLPFDMAPLIEQDLMQADGGHPTAEGYRVLLPSLLAVLEPVLAETRPAARP